MVLGIRDDHNPLGNPLSLDTATAIPMSPSLKARQKAIVSDSVSPMEISELLDPKEAVGEPEAPSKAAASPKSSAKTVEETKKLLTGMTDFQNAVDVALAGPQP